MHYGNGVTTRCRDVLAAEFDYCSDLNTTQFLKRMIEAEKPDFIAFTGILLITIICFFPLIEQFLVFSFGRIYQFIHLIADFGLSQFEPVH